MQEYQLSQQCTDKMAIILFIYCRRKTCRTVHQKVKKLNFVKKIIIRLNLAREWLNQVLAELKRQLDQRIQ